MKYLLRQDGVFRSFLRSITLFRVYQKLLDERTTLRDLCEAQDPSGRLWWKFSGAHWVSRIFFDYAMEVRRPRRLLEKTPTHDMRFRQIFSTFPRAKMIYIARHPVDIYSSFRKRLLDDSKLGKPEEVLSWLRISPEAFCTLYRKSWESYKASKHEFESAVCLVRYEDLAERFEDAWKLILKFLGESSEWSERDFRDRVLLGTKRWQDYISEAEARFIENELSSELNALDYSRYISGSFEKGSREIIFS